MQKKILLTDCPDSKGLIAHITNVCQKNQLNIIKNNEFVDHQHQRFFMRTELEGCFDNCTLLEDLDFYLPKGSSRQLVSQQRKRIVILVTKEAHCLGDILMKSTYGSMDVEIAAVIGNYTILEDLVTKFNIPYHCISHEGISREEHEDKIMQCIAPYQPDLVILAKYMRILSPKFVSAYANRLINIHHSFLPAFIGARPYQQAFDRGVKIIGATAHFVNNNLDEGPIITQDIAHIDHAHNVESLIKVGRDVEKSVLSRALQHLIDDKVFVYANRTVVFK
ncbi:formyltetrahydrofolate deformylase [Psychromonas sp. CNPT3]|uniref:formyltetrahydrofolate deformylase n=1 Tax=Psychromonas sp. CNPT3 TaxID=314282 RepID=UPI00006EA02E|nr:formyltetrahydrofolate deformylase [Psychromonas sp. CNPT3]AGH80596.1 formyltetrahydrofolate deformylase [Psychromonas sp. CNPT3]